MDFRMLVGQILLLLALTHGFVTVCSYMKLATLIRCVPNTSHQMPGNNNRSEPDSSQAMLMYSGFYIVVRYMHQHNNVVT